MVVETVKTILSFRKERKRQKREFENLTKRWETEEPIKKQDSPQKPKGKMLIERHTARKLPNGHVIATTQGRAYDVDLENRSFRHIDRFPPTEIED